jgi:hypothetical protein
MGKEIEGNTSEKKGYVVAEKKVVENEKRVAKAGRKRIEEEGNVFEKKGSVVAEKKVVEKKEEGDEARRVASVVTKKEIVAKEKEEGDEARRVASVVTKKGNVAKKKKEGDEAPKVASVVAKKGKSVVTKKGNVAEKEENKEKKSVGKKNVVGKVPVAVLGYDKKSERYLIRWSDSSKSNMKKENFKEKYPEMYISPSSVRTTRPLEKMVKNSKFGQELAAEHFLHVFNQILERLNLMSQAVTCAKLVLQLWDFARALGAAHSESYIVSERSERRKVMNALYDSGNARYTDKAKKEKKQSEEKKSLLENAGPFEKKMLEKLFAWEKFRELVEKLKTTNVTALITDQVVNDLSKRTDTASKQQLLSALQSLLFVCSGGHTNNPALAIFFAFGGTVEVLDKLLEKMMKKKTDEDEKEEEEDEFLNVENEEILEADLDQKKKKRLSTAEFLEKCANAWGRIKKKNRDKFQVVQMKDVMDGILQNDNQKRNIPTPSAKSNEPLKKEKGTRARKTSCRRSLGRGRIG